MNNLTLTEFTKCNLRTVNNSLPAHLEPNFQRIKQVYDWLKSHFPNLLLNCGYRSPAFNKAVGGDPNSYHLQGLAIDIDTPDNRQNKAIFQFIIDNYQEQFGQIFDYLIWEKGDDNNAGWLHVQIHQSNQIPRGIIHRFFEKDGKWIYRQCDRNGKIVIK